MKLPDASVLCSAVSLSYCMTTILWRLFSPRRVRVQAVNAIGIGAFSSSVKAVTLPLPPAPPILECTGATWNTVKLRWTESKADHYTVKMKKGDSVVSETVSPRNSTPCYCTDRICLYLNRLSKLIL